MYLSGIKVLLIDDDEDTCAICTEVLASAGAIVEAVSSAKDAFAILEKNSPDIVVSDLIMPVMDGFELVRRLREDGWTGPILALSAAARKSDVRLALESGCDQHLAKPVDISVLIETIARLLGDAKR